MAKLESPTSFPAASFHSFVFVHSPTYFIEQQCCQIFRMDDEGGRGTFREKLVRGGKFHGFIDHTNFCLKPYRTEEF